MSKSTLEIETEVEDEVIKLATSILPSIKTVADTLKLLEAVDVDLAVHEHRVKVGRRIRKQYEYHLNRLRREAGEIK